MKLSSLIQDLPITEKRHFADLEITGISSHSAQVRPGNLFVAVFGARADGHAFIGDALERGATALVVEKEVSVPQHLPIFRVKDSRAGLSRLAATWYDHPSDKIPVVGVTGTNGKTTITYLLQYILQVAGKNPGVIGTLGYRYGKVLKPTSHTTPDAQEVQRILSEMVENHADIALMEVSSHAIDLRRVEDVRFDAGIFTNLTPEHLDYHKSMELYFESKKRLFRELLGKGKGVKRAILNADDAYGMKVIDLPPPTDFWTYSAKPQSKWNVFVRSWRSDLNGISAQISTPAGDGEFHSPLIGGFNLSNILAAIGTALSLEIPLPTILKAVEDFAGVPGRLERIPNRKGIHVFVDYAHTPDALKNVLRALKELDARRVISLFGCGGDRDRAKRPIMGREVARLSDQAIVTSDNPRTEDPQQIISEILPGVEEGGMSVGKDCVVEVDRRRAIHQAIAMAGAGDVVLIAGKGHEDYQIIGTEKRPFDDRAVARRVLAGRGVRAGVRTTAPAEAKPS